MAERSARKQRPLTRLRVLRTEWLTPHIVRVVLGGPGFASFEPNGFTDAYVKLLFPQPDVHYPEPFDMQRVREEYPREQWPTTRTYTVRYHDPTNRELAIDFVCHGDTGLAAPWAAAAEPGEELMMLGPGGAYAPDPEADWHLLVGDESALPAISAALERLEQVAAGAKARVVLEVTGVDDEVKLAGPKDTSISWIHRESDPDGLVRTVRQMDFPPGVPHAFVHGEAGFIRELRRHLLDERAVPKDALSISGYWRRGKNEDGWQAEKAEEKAAEQARSVRS
ncbi:MAG: siderophore-interacting protein [Pseudonocardiaceae bacterium]|nr:siderophore-interacting protein [Pseudonocardiaceae bacterium]